MRSWAVVFLAFAATVLLMQVSLEAKTYRVPQEFDDVRTALRAASYGDTVLVGPGKYRVQARVGSGVVITSSDGPDSTVLWNTRWHILELDDCDLATKVSGFTFEGKGCNISVACTTGAPVIEGNVIKQSWDGISLHRSNALVRNNVIRGCNRGIHMYYSDPRITDNVFRNNREALSLVSSAPFIVRCTIQKNTRGILILGHSYPTIGGSLDNANDLISNGFNIYNAGLHMEGNEYTDQREVAVASYNYWGSVCPDERKFRGEVVYRPWTDEAHEKAYEQCPKEEAVEESGSR